MSSAMLGLLSMGLLIAAAGLFMWLWIRGRTDRQMVVRHLDRRLSPEVRPKGSLAAPGAALPEPDGVRRRAEHILGKIGDRLLSPAQLGVLSRSGLLVLAVAALLFSLLVAARLGPVAATAALLLFVLGSVFYIWIGVQKRRRKLVQQLPGFLDSMVRLISIGNSTHAAFQISVGEAKAPLRPVLDDVNALVKAGVELEPALLQIARGIRIEGLFLLAAVLGVGVRYGGRADLLLERMAFFIRDREQADRELVAMSAETRLSAWVLGLLPMVVGGGIIVINAAYFTRMWDDPSGRSMLYGALALQISGAFVLYRLARLA